MLPIWRHSHVAQLFYNESFHFSYFYAHHSLLLFQDISPHLTKVSRDVDAREKELTHMAHREILIRSLDSIKTLAPILICAMKIYVQLLAQGNIPELIL